MKVIITFSLVLLSHLCLFAQNFSNFTSSKYGYTIEYPSDFFPMQATGRNVDFKVAHNSGSSIIVVARTLPYEERNLTAANLLEMPNEQWEQGMQLPNVKVVKKGKCITNGGKGMFIHYTSKGLGDDATTLYYMNYMFVDDGYIYAVTATCDINELSLMQAKFFRALESFSLN